MILSFKRFIAVLALLAPGVTLAAYPTIGKSDVKSCMKEVSALHRAEINYFRNETNHECGKPYYGCDSWKDYLRETSSMNDLAWYIQGRDECQGPIPCFGVNYFNKSDPNIDLIVNTYIKDDAPVFDEAQARADYHKVFDESDRKHKKSADDARYSEDMFVLEQKLFVLAHAADRCVAKIWYAKVKDGKYTAGNTRKRSVSAGDNGKKTSSGSNKPKPRAHVPDAVASKCLSLLEKSLYGGFKNSCNFPVEYTYCAYKPKKDAWTEAFDCEKDKFGSDMIEANGIDEAHTKGAKEIRWGACRSEKDYPVTPFAKWDASKNMFFFNCREWAYKEGDK